MFRQFFCVCVWGGGACVCVHAWLCGNMFSDLFCMESPQENAASVPCEKPAQKEEQDSLYKSVTDSVNWRELWQSIKEPFI